MAKLVEYRDTATMAEGLAALVAGELLQALTERGRASLAVPGGSTPKPFLKILSGAAIDWSHISVMLTDERVVPVTSPRSNSAMVKDTLLTGRAAAARFVPFVTASGDTEERPLKEQSLLPLDCCVLGMGTDGHIASLFPGADGLTKAIDPTCPDDVVVMQPATASEARISMTGRVLNGARSLHLLIAGAEKLAVLEAARSQPGKTLDTPVRLILSHPRLTIHYTGEVVQ
jgi:6-phosphogluconolactonase